MSELKAYRFLGQDEVWPDANLGSDYYLKSEADKVIAELEMKLAAAKLVLRLNEPKALYSNLETMSRLNHEIDVVERREIHQKYKRCLAMARIAQDDWHMHNSFYAMGHQEFEKRKCEFYDKWHLRWLELAEKFKEAK